MLRLMNDRTFYWHDYETFGVVPRRDRPAQFAGVRTDSELNEIEPPLTVYCHPPTDSLPEPESCLITGITPQVCLQRGVPEHAFAAAIEGQLARPGTIGVGYNSIRFDDEVTRYLFWRNLIEPYQREYKNDCGRWDLIDVVRCARALRPDGIVWPAHADGRPSFKLQDLTAANGLAHEAAHDASSDVSATLSLARLVKSNNPRLWDFCLKLHRKDAVRAEMDSAQQQGRPFLHVSGMYPVERGNLAVVWPLATHPTNKNEVIVWDLAEAPSVLQSLDIDTLRQRLFTRNDDLPEGMTRLPIKTIHINKSPIVIANLKTLSTEMAARWGLDVDQALRHADSAARQAPLVAGFWSEVYARPESNNPIDVDEDLYGGFVTPPDRALLERLRRLTPQALADQRASFADPRLAELLLRYRARNFPDTLSDADRQHWEQHRAHRFHGGDSGGEAGGGARGEGGRETLAEYLERIDAMFESADERGQEILGALVDYATEIAPERD
jgi:exodeoxyribonuclease-1